jgi:hypothetical protein
LYRLAADAVLVSHAAIVGFVVLVPPLIVAGNLRGWQWVNARSFRVAHAMAILVVIAEAWIGIVCPLTTLEMRLRARAGATVHSGGFIEYWLQRILYQDFPGWVFTLAYSAFGILVLMTCRRFPPAKRKARRKV